MKNKLLLGVGALLLAVGLFIGYEVLVGSKKSPKATVAFNQGNLDVQVDYCRPSKKGRLLFGEKSAGALVPNGKYWRLGANAATKITFGHNVSFAGKPVTAGSYRMYAIPSATSWKIVLNSQPSGSGASEPDHDKDVLSVELPVEVAATPSEQFTIDFTGEPTAAKLNFTWDGTLVRVPISAS